MTAALLDTHALIWFLEDDKRLSPAAREVIAPKVNTLFYSAASVWEMAIKISTGRLGFKGDPILASNREGIDSLPITAQHAWSNRLLDSRRDHKDPFDRMIAAQAIAEGLPVISADAGFDAYGVQRIW